MDFEARINQVTQAQGGQIVSVFVPYAKLDEKATDETKKEAEIYDSLVDRIHNGRAQLTLFISEVELKEVEDKK